MEARNLTLWILDYGDRHAGKLVPLYAVDEETARVEARLWAMKHKITLPEAITLLHFPRGFTIFRRILPGELKLYEEE